MPTRCRGSWASASCADGRRSSRLPTEPQMHWSTECDTMGSWQADPIQGLLPGKRVVVLPHRDQHKPASSGVICISSVDKVQRESIVRVNDYLCRRHDVTNPDPTLRGSVCDPGRSGAAGGSKALNWATKFFVDALLREEQVHGVDKRKLSQPDEPHGDSRAHPAYSWAIWLRPRASRWNRRRIDDAARG